jgi:hypothetical protein
VNVKLLELIAGMEQLRQKMATLSLNDTPNSRLWVRLSFDRLTEAHALIAQAALREVA